MRDLGRCLRDISYNVDEVICYRKLPKKLSNEVIKSIENSIIIAATFFSKQTASLFFKQVKYLPDGFIAFCISEEVASTILTLYPKVRIKIRVANEPSINEMLKLIVAAPEFGV